jgi:4-amino-4-deoxy-L-arabinose transferase-like glycosyltransferase
VRVGFLGLALGVLLSVGLGVSPFLDFTSNEGRYAEVAREMVVSGDWVVPRLNGQAMLTKTSAALLAHGARLPARCGR